MQPLFSSCFILCSHTILHHCIRHTVCGRVSPVCVLHIIVLLVTNLCAFHLLFLIFKQKLRRSTNLSTKSSLSLRKTGQMYLLPSSWCDTRWTWTTAGFLPRSGKASEPPPYLSTPLSRVIQKKHSERLRVPAFLPAKLQLNHNVILCSAEVTLTARSVCSQPLGSDHSQPYNNPVSRGGREHQHAVTHL